MIFDVEGPFKLARYGKKKLITGESIRNLKRELDRRRTGLSRVRGCYVFVIHAGKGYTPYYVGQACKRSILREAMNPSNLSKYNDVCSETNGKPMLFVLRMQTTKGRDKRRGNSGSKSTTFLERWLIAEGFKKNPDLKNNKQTKFLRDLHVVGIFNAKKGEATNASRELKRALW